MIKKYVLNYKKKYHEMPVVAKAALWFTFATVLQKGISFITVPIFTRIMSTEQYGIFSVYLSWISVLTILGGLDFHTCIYINSLSKMDNEVAKDELAVSLLNLSFVITGCWIVIYLTAPTFWESVLGIPKNIVLLMFLEVFFIPAVNLWSTKQRYNYKYKTLVLWTIVQVILNAVFGILFVIISNQNNQAFARVFSIALVQVVFGIVLVIYFIKKVKRVFITKWWSKALQLHLPLLPHSLSLNILSSVDRVMINAIVGATQTAIYSVAYSASMVINIIKLSITQAMTPWIYECIKKKQYENLKKRSNNIMLLVMIMSFLFILFAPELIWIVGSEQYMEAIYVVPPVAASVFFTFLYNLFSTIEFYYERTNQIMIASILAALINLILNFIFIRIFGYIAAGYTTLFCYIFLSIAHYYFMKKSLLANCINEEPFDIKLILLLSIIMMLSTIVFSALYKFSIIRYLVILFIFVIGFIFKNKIAIIMKDLRKS